jgi:hypothetical protein
MKSPLAPLFQRGGTVFFTVAETMINARNLKVDDFTKSQKSIHPVIPAKAGIQYVQIVAKLLDPGFHRGDELRYFYKQFKLCIFPHSLAKYNR